MIKALYKTCRRRRQPAGEEGASMPTAEKTTIDVGPIGIRFLVEAEGSAGSATVFECRVPADARCPRLTATTHSRRRSTGWRADPCGRSTDARLRSDRAIASVSDAGRPTASRTAARRRRRSWRSPPRRFRAGLLHGGGGRHRRSGGRPARPRGDRRGDATPRSDPRAPTVNGSAAPPPLIGALLRTPVGGRPRAHAAGPARGRFR